MARKAVIIAFAAFVVSLLFLCYVIVNQAFTVAYLTSGLERSEQNLDAVLSVFNTTDLSKDQIIDILNKDSLILNSVSSADTLDVHDLNLVFQNGRLAKILRQ